MNRKIFVRPCLADKRKLYLISECPTWSGRLTQSVCDYQRDTNRFQPKRNLISPWIPYPLLYRVSEFLFSWFYSWNFSNFALKCIINSKAKFFLLFQLQEELSGSKIISAELALDLIIQLIWSIDQLRALKCIIKPRANFFLLIAWGAFWLLDNFSGVCPWLDHTLD